MGHPKKQKKKYERPKKPYDKHRIEEERKIIQEFGLRRKHEIWRAESMLREFRRRARELQARRNEQKEKELFERLNKMGVRCSKLDDVLTIRLEHILGRRLQTIVYKKGLANTPHHARQLIVHGHVLVNERKVLWPSYIVSSSEEDRISLSSVIAAKMIEVQKK